MPLIKSWEEYVAPGPVLAWLVWRAEPDEALRALLAAMDAGRARGEGGSPGGRPVLVEPPGQDRGWPEVTAAGSGLPLSPFGFLVHAAAVGAPGEAAGASGGGELAGLDGWCGDLPPESAEAVLAWARPRARVVQADSVPLDLETATPIVPNPMYAERLAAAVEKRNGDVFHRWISGVGSHAAAEMVARLDWDVVTARTHRHWRTGS